MVGTYNYGRSMTLWKGHRCFFYKKNSVDFFTQENPQFFFQPRNKLSSLSYCS